jgi:peptide/nickel transport system substrate-binding protein
MLDKQNNRLFLLFLVVPLALFLVACDSAPPTPDPTATPEPTIEATEEVTATTVDDTLRMFFWQAPTILNPHLSAGTKDLTASRIVYEPLASPDINGVLIPFLAAEIPSLENGGVAEDGFSVTWKLREDVQWADGEQFSADDVVFTYEFITNPEVNSTSAPNYKGIKSVEAIDDYIVQVTFTQPNPAWDVPFIGGQGQIVPRHMFEEYNGSNALDAPANLNAVGTGPYFVEEFRSEAIIFVGDDAVNTIKIIYKPNPFYREESKPYFSQIELLGGGGDSVFAAQLIRDDEIDFVYSLAVNTETLVDMESTGMGVDVPILAAFSERIMLNFTDPNQETVEGERSSLEFPHPFLTDLKVRQAIAHAIDRDAIAEVIGRAGVITHNILVAPSIYQSDSTPYLYDLEEAEQLLDEAGWIDSDGDGIRDKDGGMLQVVYQTSVNPIRQSIQEIVKVRLEEIGINVEIRAIDSSIYFGPVEGSTNTRRHFYADFEEFAFSNKVPDPAAYMAAWTCDEAAQMSNNWSNSNWSRYCNPEYDALYEQALIELNPAQRQQLFIEMNELLTQDVAVIPLYHQNWRVGISSSLEGIELTPWDLDVWNIAEWRRVE